MHLLRNLRGTSVAIALLALGGATDAPFVSGSTAVAEATRRNLPEPPADGMLGFVVETFAPTLVPGMDACPDGTVSRLRFAYLDTLPAPERERLLRKENEKELERLWKSYAYGPRETNVCSQPDMFDRPVIRTVQSPHAWGMDLDRDGGAGSGDADGCAQEDFTSPTGEKGIDNQEYRAMGCTLEWRGNDGSGGDLIAGSKSFHASGEWTQVLLLRGVDSLVRDDNVEVIYANTPDRPILGSKGEYLNGATFTVSDKPPRNRNVLRGRIANGVLTTEPEDILLAQTWGQGGARDIRGNRSKFDFRKGRLRLEFQPDGSLQGMLGGYKPLFDVNMAQELGGAGTALVAGMDCAAYLSTLKKLADGLRDPKTGECTAVSSALHIIAIPAFVNDLPARQGTAAQSRR